MPTQKQLDRSPWARYRRDCWDPIRREHRSGGREMEARVFKADREYWKEIADHEARQAFEDAGWQVHWCGIDPPQP